MVVGLAVIIFGGLYLTGYLAAGDKLPRNADISGVAVGRLSPAQAVAKLSAELGPRANQPMPLAIGDRTATVAPADAGLQIDYAASVAKAGGGRSFNPVQIYSVLTGGARTEAVVTVDQTKLNSAVARLAAPFARPPVDAALAYAGTEVKQTPAQPGLAVRQPEAALLIRNGFLRATAAIPVPVEDTPADITNEEASQVVASFAAPAVSAPVKVGVGGTKSFAVTPQMISATTTFVPQDGTLAPVIDAASLRKKVDTSVAKVLVGKPKDATVRLVNGVPKVIAAVDGAAVSADNLVKAVRPVLTKAGAERTTTVQLTRTKASFTADKAAKLGIKEVTGRFTTYFPYRPYRNTNIARTAANLNNTLVKPGQTFSMNKAVGARTKANGFIVGQVFDGTRARTRMGGEESQTAATAFSALFFAGLKDVQHRPHAVYLDRFPAGREANVDGAKQDLRFRNDTKYGVLVQAFAVRAEGGRRGSVTVKIWSTRTYDAVLASPTSRSRLTNGRTVRDGSAGCVPMSPARGFDADYQRLFYRGGQVVKRQSYHWRYAPANRVTCG